MNDERIVDGHLRRKARRLTTTKQAIRKSIKHWCIDVRCPLQKGRKMYCEGFGVMWKDTKKSVALGTNSCALCGLFFRRQCENCPLKEIDMECTAWNSPYDTFFHSPTLENANVMIVALIRAYKNTI